MRGILTSILTCIVFIGLSNDLENAILLRNQGQVDQAIEILLQRNLNDPEVLIELGICYSMAGLDEKSVIYFTKVLSLPKPNPYESRAENLIGIYYLKSGQFKESKKHFRNAALLNIKRENSTELSKNYTNLSKSYFELNKIDSAIYYQNECIKEASGDSMRLTKAYLNLSYYYFQLENPEATEAAEAALRYATSVYDKINAHHNLAMVYEAEDPKRTNNHLLAYYELKAELNEIDLQRKIAEIEDKYQAQLEELRMERNKQLVSLFSIFILLFGAYATYAEYRKKKVKLPTMNLVERIKNFIPETAKFYPLAYTEAAPISIETKIYEIIKELILKSDTDQWKIILNGSGEEIKVVLVSKEARFKIDCILKLESQAKQNGIQFRHTNQGAMNSFHLEWQMK